jgi:outer membrane lipoprotein-sorting protein
MKRSICLLTLTFFVSPAFSQQEGQTEPAPPEAQKEDIPKRDPKAVEILKQVDETTKKVKAVRYFGEISVTGTATRRGANMEGTVIFSGIDDRTPEKFLIKAKMTGSAGAKDFIIGGNGDSFFFVDPERKTVYEDLDLGVIGPRGNRAMGLAMIEFTYPTPFSDEINGKSVELKGEEKIGDEDCHRIHIVYNQAGQAATWWFSKKDHLPRAVERVFATPDAVQGTTLLKISKLETDPKIDDSIFETILPEGYTKNTDDFAP